MLGTDGNVRAREASDVAGLVALLREDATPSMAPMPMVSGARSIGEFVAGSIFPLASMRLLETDANGRPAFAAYAHDEAGTPFSHLCFSYFTSMADGSLPSTPSAIRDSSRLSTCRSCLTG